MKEKIKSAIALMLADIRKNRVAFIVVLAVWAGLLLMFHRFCPMVLITGLPCPGCGLSRAFVSFLTFHPVIAFKYNASFILWAVLIIAAIRLRYFKRTGLSSLRIPLLSVIAATLILYVWRLACEFPGSEPMVYYPDNLLATLIPAYDRMVQVFLP